jgi:hypothetical protein
MGIVTGGDMDGLTGAVIVSPNEDIGGDHPATSP